MKSQGHMWLQEPDQLDPSSAMYPQSHHMCSCCLKRAEKSRFAAKARRDQEGEEIQALAQQLPFHKETIQHLDKASVLRLATSYLRVKQHTREGQKQFMEELGGYRDNDPAYQNAIATLEDIQEGDLMLEALNSFLIFITRKGHIMYVSENVTSHLGLNQAHMIGENILQFLHPRDHKTIMEQMVYNPEDKTTIGAPVPDLTHSDLLAMDVDVDSDSMSEFDALKESGQSITQDRSFIVRMKSCLPKRPGSKARSFDYMVVQWSGRLKLRQVGNKYQVEGMTCLCKPLLPLGIVEIRIEGNMFMSRHSLDMRFTYCDTRIMTLVGYDPEEVVGKTAYQFHNPLDAHKVSNCHQHLIHAGQSTSKYYRFMGKLGDWIWMQTRATIIYNTGGDAQYVVCMNYVVSENEARRATVEEQKSLEKSGHPTGCTCGEAMSPVPLSPQSSINSPTPSIPHSPGSATHSPGSMISMSPGSSNLSYSPGPFSVPPSQPPSTPCLPSPSSSMAASPGSAPSPSATCYNTKTVPAVPPVSPESSVQFSPGFAQKSESQNNMATVSSPTASVDSPQSVSSSTSADSPSSMNNASSFQCDESMDVDSAPDSTQADLGGFNNSQPIWRNDLGNSTNMQREADLPGYGMQAPKVEADLQGSFQCGQQNSMGVQNGQFGNTNGRGLEGSEFFPEDDVDMIFEDLLDIAQSESQGDEKMAANINSPNEPCQQPPTNTPTDQILNMLQSAASQAFASGHGSSPVVIQNVFLSSGVQAPNMPHIAGAATMVNQLVSGLTATAMKGRTSYPTITDVPDSNSTLQQQVKQEVPQGMTELEYMVKLAELEQQQAFNKVPTSAQNASPAISSGVNVSSIPNIPNSVSATVPEFPRVSGVQMLTPDMGNVISTMANTHGSTLTHRNITADQHTPTSMVNNFSSMSGIQQPRLNSSSPAVDKASTQQSWSPAVNVCNMPTSGHQPLIVNQHQNNVSEVLKNGCSGISTWASGHPVTITSTMSAPLTTSQSPRVASQVYPFCDRSSPMPAAHVPPVQQPCRPAMAADNVAVHSQSPGSDQLTSNNTNGHISESLKRKHAKHPLLTSLLTGKRRTLDEYRGAQENLEKMLADPEKTRLLGPGRTQLLSQLIHSSKNGQQLAHKDGQSSPPQGQCAGQQGKPDSSVTEKMSRLEIVEARKQSKAAKAQLLTSMLLSEDTPPNSPAAPGQTMETGGKFHDEPVDLTDTIDLDPLSPFTQEITDMAACLLEEYDGNQEPTVNTSTDSNFLPGMLSATDSIDQTMLYIDTAKQQPLEEVVPGQRKNFESELDHAQRLAEESQLKNLLKQSFHQAFLDMETTHA
ncbi:PREDICTED: circadian locomoter output cycles protein kaput-like isoform X1 [Branchiostoma belcheri]|uniref:Circadian locomoter output cycles protein kaput-like isoform X1 n=1 Tax=Branchiostoma belcheri TaxID=7741 RepID=A0A6P4Y9Y7_BRABE|nr:PREDICTED: circadian locomoter output cycles protein kaput-like isoform X1 [Branchiostoma belcheri]